MDAFVERMEQLLLLKKDKNHKVTRQEKKEFSEALEQLINEDNGLSPRAEHFLYEGVVFDSAKPFVNWIAASDNCFDALDSLFQGDLYLQDSTTTFRILVSILAQMIRSDAKEKNIVCPVMKRIPQASKNKNGKYIGDGHRIVLKYFILSMNGSEHYPTLSELELKPVSVESFVSVFSFFINKIDPDKLSKKDIKTLNAVKEWLRPGNSASVNDEGKATAAPQKSPAQEPVTNRETKIADLPSFNDEGGFAQLMSLLNQTMMTAEQLHQGMSNLEKEKAVQQEIILSYRKKTATLQEEAEEYLNRERAMMGHIEENNEKILELGSRINVLEKEKADLEQKVVSNEQEIAMRIQMTEALSRDRTKQSDELLHRLASKLKVEYRDYKDAENLPMSIELGENMREQLKSIFSILLKTGLSFD